MTTTERRRTLPGIVLSAALAFPVAAPAAAQDEDAGHAGAEVKGAAIGRLGDPAAVDPDEFQFSDAEARLWMSDHLKNITRPARLRYAFVKSGSFEEGFTDSVFLDVLSIHEDGSKDVNMQFFTGHRSQPFEPENVSQVTGNPILGIYMRGDVHDMNRLTSGSWRYFQRRIKWALANSAEVEEVSIQFNGEAVPGYRISITPYTNDPRRRQLADFSRKSYEFLLSDRVPGTIYRIRTVVPSENGSDAPLLEESLTLQQVEFPQ
jgi:hypothetical protein